MSRSRNDKKMARRGKPPCFQAWLITSDQIEGLLEFRTDRLWMNFERQERKAERKEISYGQEIDKGQDGSRVTDVCVQGTRRFERTTRERFYALAEEPRQLEEALGWDLASHSVAAAGRASLSLPCGWGVARRS